MLYTRTFESYLNDLSGQDKLNECIIAHTVLDDDVILAKNRDRTYTANVKIIRDLIGDVEIVYILDVDTDWSEGMNSYGIGIVNSALMVDADENAKKLAKPKRGEGKTATISDDGLKIRKALGFKTINKAVDSIINFVGKDKKDIGVKGHTFVASPKESWHIELSSEHAAVSKKLDRKKNHVRTNHGYEHPDVGYTSGKNKTSSESRWELGQKALDDAKIPEDILDGLSAYWPVDIRNNPYRDKEKVKNPTNKDVLSTTGQILMDLNRLEFHYRFDKDESVYKGIEDRTPENYKPKINIVVQPVVNKKKENK